MPRLPSVLLRRARAVGSNFVLLLRVCRDFSSARNELRWLREHVVARRSMVGTVRQGDGYLRRLCIARSRGKPLQYILGTEYFGELEIACKEGVLIPRQETAASVTHLARLIRDGSFSGLTPEAGRSLRVLDLCTGTGCIPLLLHHLLGHGSPPHPALDTQILGIDTSPHALSLARANIQRIFPAGQRSNVVVARADVLSAAQTAHFGLVPSLQQVLDGLESPTFDILTANPPYISPSSFASPATTRSVRKFEPKLALVPPALSADAPSGSAEGQMRVDDVRRADGFYTAILQAADLVKAKVALMEVADLEQAMRVAGMALQRLPVGPWQMVEIWRDEPDAGDETQSKLGFEVVAGRRLTVRGRGNGRTVVCWRDIGA